MNFQATEETVKQVTAGELKRAIKGASVYMHVMIDRSHRFGPVNSIFTVSCEGKKDETGKPSRTIDVPGYVANGYTDATREVPRTYQTYKRDDGTSFGCSSGGYTEYDREQFFAPKKGFWSLRHGEETLRSVLSLLPPSAIVSFHVELDGGTSPVLTPHKMHADTFRLKAYLLSSNGGIRKEWEFIIDYSCGLHNTARFGFPSTFDPES